MPWGWGWKRAEDLPDNPLYGRPLGVWDSSRAAFIPGDVDPSAEVLRQDPGAPYGRPKPDEVPYDYYQYARRFHKFKADGTPGINWPPNEGAVRGTKLDYSCAQKFIRDFGDKMDRLGARNGSYFGLVEDKAPASYEARAIHYESLYDPPHTYTLKPDKFPKSWTIRVMDTAPALGQLGGSVGLVFHDETGKEMSVDDLTEKEAF
jgi:hypothetical protein